VRGHFTFDDNGVLGWARAEPWAPYSSDVYTDSTHETINSIIQDDPSEYNTRTETTTESQSETSDPARVAAILGFYDVERAALAFVVNNTINLSSQAFATKRLTDPDVDQIGDPKSLLNFVPDTGASKHMTPRLDDLFDVEEGLDLSVEVADGHIIKCTKVGKIKISMIDDDGIPMEAILHNVMYVPGLSRRLFSITTFAEHGHKAIVVKNSIQFLFNAVNNTISSVTVPFTAGCTLATHVKSSVTVPTTYKIGDSSTKTRISLELLYKRLASRSQRSLLAAANHDVWQDATVRMENDPDLIGVQVSTIRAADRIKFPSTPSDFAGQLVGVDLLPFPPDSGITPDTKFLRQV
jgi:hypothetical protein